MSLPDRPTSCVARVAGGTVYCQRCSLSWDYGDDDAPACRTDEQGHRIVLGGDDRPPIKEQLRRRFG